MGKVKVWTFLTVDGVYQAPGGPDEDREGGFEHGGWSAPFWDDELGSRAVAESTSSDALLLGRKTYDIFNAYWPTADRSDPIAAHLNGIPKYVASRTVDTLTWDSASLLEGEVPAAVGKLKAEHDIVGVAGSGELIQTLLRHDLVDEFALWVFPVVTGSGKRLFAEGTIPGGLKLIESTATGTGVVTSVYARAGAMSYGQIGN
jgi:dihydrofolate reductase